MDYFFIAQIKINDQDEYEKYIERVDEVFNKFNGEYLSVDDSPKILEGTWTYTRTVLIRFDSEEEFNEWYYSDEYQDILKYRLSAANCDSILIRGK